MKAWKVKRPNGRRTETVYADYAKLEGGVLIFRNNGKNGEYPQLVMCYAAGHWTSVEDPRLNLRKE